MATRRKRRVRTQRDNQRDLMLRYFQGETLDRSELLRVLTSTAQPGQMTLEEWRAELSKEVGT